MVFSSIFLPQDINPLSTRISPIKYAVSKTIIQIDWNYSHILLQKRMYKYVYFLLIKDIPRESRGADASALCAERVKSKVPGCVYFFETLETT